MVQNSKIFHFFLFFCLAVTYISFHACSTTSLNKQQEVASPEKYSIKSRNLNPGKFIKEWLVLGPVPVFKEDTESEDIDAQKEVFKQDQIPLDKLKDIKKGGTIRIDDSEYQWESLESKEDIIDLNRKFNEADFAIAYAYTEIELNEARKVLFGIGGDDGIQIWLNGELIHNKWSPQGVVIDNDLVSMNLKEGKNQLIFKIQDYIGPWAFCCRPLSAKNLTDRLINAAGLGILDDIEMLLANGADVNAKNEKGLTPLNSAEIHGRPDTVGFLTKNGADKNIAIPPKKNLVDMLFEKKTEGVTPGVAVLISKDGEVLYKKGFGYANIGHKVPVTPETKFRIGSITKQFTASAILKLIEEGKLALTDKLSKFLSDFPRGDEVTIYHLLTHTSGIHSYTNMPDFMDTVTVGIKPEELIKIIEKDDYDFNPGEKWLYNNSGYVILGYLIEKISGKTYAEYLKQNFFNPLDMNDTGIHTANAILDHEAEGYSYVNGIFQKAIDWNMTRAGGAGAIYSTVEDLFKWNEAVFNGKVLKQESLDAAFTPVKLKDGSKADATIAGVAGYGFGWGINEFRGLKTISHGGGLNGFITDLTRIPDKNITITVLTNCAPAKDINPGQTVREITELFFWNELEEQASYVTDKTIDPKLYDQYAGKYTVSGVGEITISPDDKSLYAQLTGQPRLEIFPSSKSEFFAKVVDAQVTFVPGNDGKIDHLVLHQGGLDIESPRKDDMDSHKEIDLNPDELESFIGVYKLAANFALTVTVEDGKLTIQATGQSKIPFYPESKTRFFCKLVDAQISFVMGEDGKVDHLILHQGGFERKSKPKEALPPPRKEVELSNAVLESYAGVYELRPGITITVTVEDNKLLVQLTGQNKIPFYAESNTKFFCKLVDAQISFVTDKDGNIDHLVLHQGGFDQKAVCEKEGLSE